MENLYIGSPDQVFRFDTFLELTDTPSSFPSADNQFVKGNDAANALEFFDLFGSANTWTEQQNFNNKVLITHSASSNAFEVDTSDAAITGLVVGDEGAGNYITSYKSFLVGDSVPDYTFEINGSPFPSLSLIGDNDDFTIIYDGGVTSGTDSWIISSFDPIRIETGIFQIEGKFQIGESGFNKIGSVDGFLEWSHDGSDGFITSSKGRVFIPQLDLGGASLRSLGDATDEIDVRRTIKDLDNTNVTGAGLIAIGGNFSNATNLNYKIEITTGGAIGAAIYRWSDDGGATYDESNITTSFSPHTMNNGLKVWFTTGSFNTSDFSTIVAIGTDNQLNTFIVDTRNNQTIFGGNVVPKTDSTYDLGTTGVRWKDFFVDDITVTDTITAETIKTDELVGKDSTTIFFREGGTTTNGFRLSNLGNGSSFFYSDQPNFVTKWQFQEDLMTVSVTAGISNVNLFTMTGTKTTFSDPVTFETSITLENGGASSTISQPNVFGNSTLWELDSNGNGQGFLQIKTGPDDLINIAGAQIQVFVAAVNSTSATLVLTILDTTIDATSADLGQILFRGADSATRTGAAIFAAPTATWGTNTNDAPTQLEFYTQSDGNTDALGIARMIIGSDGTITLADAINMAFNTTTGTKIGTATGQKIGFWNVTPVVQQSHVVDADGTLADITAKFNTLLAQMATTGMQAAS